MRPMQEELESEEKEFEYRLNNWKGFVKMPTEDILKKVKYRVCVEKLFKSDEYAKLCKLEKKRLKNIGNNLTVMMFLGLPLPSEKALRAKVGLPPEIDFKIKEESDEDDEAWKPSISKKTPGLINTSEVFKRKKFIVTRCLVTSDKPDANISDDEYLSGILESFSVSEGTPVSERKNEVSTKKSEEKAKNEFAKEDDEEVQARYPKRNVSKRLYDEPDIPEDDDYLYCESCDKLFNGDCPTHGPYSLVSNTLVKVGLVDRAQRTCPEGISIGQSRIRSSGRGAWADRDFPINSVFGPYEGVNVHKDDLKNLSLVFEGGYSWEIYRKGKLSHYIDGRDERKSNWLRFINCARNEEEQTLVAYQYKGMIYYRAFKEIKMGTELLVWYGESYAEQLGITRQKLVPFAIAQKAPLPEPFSHKCNKCGKMFANSEALNRHMKSQHQDRSVIKRHKCQLCSYSTDQKGHFTSHLRTHTKERPFKCDTCGKGFTTRSHLKTHIRIHTKEQPYQCDKCGRKFNVLSSMQRHVEVSHNKCKDYVCQVCFKAFGGSQGLNKHMLIHTGVRAFKCQYCGVRFTLRGDLRTHERIHTGEKPYKCDHCSMAFTQSSQLRHHIISKHTKRYPHRCHLCDKGFMAPGQLNKHVQTCH